MSKTRRLSELIIELLPEIILQKDDDKKPGEKNE